MEASRSGWLAGPAVSADPLQSARPFISITAHLSRCDPPGEARSGVLALPCFPPRESPLSRLEAELVCGTLLTVS